MQFKKLNFIIMFIILLTHSTINSMFTFQTAHGPEYQQQFEKYMSEEQNNVLRSTVFWTAIIGMSLIICHYFTTHNKSDMRAQYPYAQKWYEAMNSKHPQAHLQEKCFKKDSFNESAAFHEIKLLSSSLQEINTIYKKQLEDKELTEQEIVAIKKYEFLLLSQAGYIENNASLKSSALSLIFYATTNSLLVPFMKLYHPIGGDVFEITTFQRSIDQFKSDYNILSIVQIIGMLLCFSCVNAYYENQGDAFAATECDDESLQTIIQTFENETNYAYRAKVLQKELKKRQQKNT